MVRGAAEATGLGPVLPLRPAWTRRSLVLGAAGFATVALVGLTWAKWAPYLGRMRQILSSGRYTSPPTSYAHAHAGLSSLAQAWGFTESYALAVGPALLVAIVIGGAVGALLPPTRSLAPPPWRGKVRGLAFSALVAAPCMMCTCCAAPVADALHRHGLRRDELTAFWLSNPLLNPAVIVFLALLVPWQYAVLRVVAGAALVMALAVAVRRLPGMETTETRVVTTTPPQAVSHVARRFVTGVMRLSVTLVPEYLLLVFLLGFASPLLPALADVAQSPLLLAPFAVVATLLVIPTGAEIPLVLGALAVGLGSSVIAVLILALPAVSLPSLWMVRRSLGTRAIVTIAVGVALFSWAIALSASLLGV